MKTLITKLRRRFSYWRWYRNLRTSIMPLGHGSIATMSGFIAGSPVLVFSPLPDKDHGEPGSPATHLMTRFEELRSFDDLPKGSVVLHFKDRNALWRHRSDVHRLWVEGFNHDA